MTTVARVKIAQFKYDPAKIEIWVGQSIVWENSDGMDHTATRVAAPAFDTGAIHPGTQSSEIKFDAATGDDGIDYACKPHPFMKGKIVVKAQPKPDDGQAGGAGGSPGS